jgi:hypothetical protein
MQCNIDGARDLTGVILKSKSNSAIKTSDQDVQSPPIIVMSTWSEEPREKEREREGGAGEGEDNMKESERGMGAEQMSSTSNSRGEVTCN